MPPFIAAMACWRYISGTFWTVTRAPTSYLVDERCEGLLRIVGQHAERRRRIGDVGPAVVLLDVDRLPVGQGDLLGAVGAVLNWEVEALNDLQRLGEIGDRECRRRAGIAGRRSAG